MGQIEVQWRHADITVGDDFEIGQVTGRLDGRGETVPEVAETARIDPLVDLEPAIIAASLAAGPHTPHLVGGQGRKIDVDQGAGREIGAGEIADHPLCPAFGRGKRHRIAHAIARERLAQGDGAMAGEGTFHGGGHGSRIGRVLGQIGAAGMLEEWKRYDTAIDAVAELHRRGRPVRLVIFGEGSLRSELEAQVERLGMRYWIRLPGRTSQILAWFAHADASVLSSRVEGMPNVLVEAMLAGCTPVSTDCETGPREILGVDERYGYLATVGDADSLADAIERALDKPIPKAALAEAVAPFEESRVIERHFALLGID